MQAVILAAGEGKRLRPLTDTIPKPMVRVGGKPILEYTIGILPQAVREVILVVGYRHDVIRNHFGSSFGGRSITYVMQDAPKGTGHALALIKDNLRKEPFFLLYADDLYHEQDILNCVQDIPTVLVKEAEHPERFGVCIVDEDDRLLSILEKHPNPSSNLAMIGVHVLNHEIFEIPEVWTPNGESNLSKQIGVWAARRPIQVIRAKFWHPIGYTEDVESANELMLGLRKAEV